MIELRKPIDTVSLCPVCACAIRKLETVDIVGSGSFVYLAHENCMAEAQGASAPEWDGKGLPPVGCECEYLPDTKQDFWDRGVYLTHFDGEHFVIISETGQVDRMSDRVPANQRFRPIRTQAERGREDLALCLQNGIEAITGNKFDDTDALVLANDLMAKGYKSEGN